MFKEWNQRGLIPGPAESEEGFFKRAANAEPQVLGSEQEEALQCLEALYGIRPDWVPITWSRKKLAFWQGGCAWVKSDQGLRSVALQLHPGNFYARKELLTHELVHAARLGFDEPKFEEYFAYKTSGLGYRRLLGPLFERLWEPYLFLGCAFLVPVSPFPLLLLLLLGGVRLFYRRLLLFRALKKLEVLLGAKACHLLFRLTDREIAFFARSPLEEIQKYITLQKSLRWKMFRECYFEGIAAAAMG
ncbi:MAG: hypothetical protein JSR80_03830 [Verrucomicrobia bacterium]|nr:hypothetical protein [Verrucomicrobiota bacterium]